ncbi:MAG: ABC transporter permease subunit [Phycisphaerales bacterium]
MRKLLAIAARELDALFRLPVGWIAIALFVLLTGVVFAQTTLIPGEPATLRYFFLSSSWMLAPVAPAISMRLISEEARTGTLEPLVTAPVGDVTIVWGKYLGAVGFLVLMLAPTLVFPLVLWGASSPAPDPGPIVTGYLGLVLVGMVYLAVGTLASALTSSQTLAFLATLIVLALALVLSSGVAEKVDPRIGRVLLAFSVPLRMRDFARGIVDTSHVVFFVSASVWFVTLAAAALESRRWR